jgi:hypothetical protein
MLEETPTQGCFCNICAHEWRGRHNRESGSQNRGSASRIPIRTREPRTTIDDLIARTGIRRDELATLRGNRRAERVRLRPPQRVVADRKGVRPTGELFDELDESRSRFAVASDPASRIPDPGSISPSSHDAAERLMADYAGTSLTIGPHPLALRRAELALRRCPARERSSARAARPARAGPLARSSRGNAREPRKDSCS